ncbi:hypothetical protein DFJ58DRAFT_744955 [Suillus subalutaceus]|uniref:uncharacterized protein n=1 Tax=Suillus subalutaceus TaxID=48586 RepID=UPI001B874FD4|nr:uncharacterized protein DFJ58DRAFT_744955 [Suillus subalutaceus]KAG1858042.1 hypothetical protein DFJ58DRAFT_744955 [Suillus subalutaceus]
MALVSNDPSWWPFINADIISCYFIVVASVGVMYDWGLTFGQEIELIWRQRWSLMTFLYLSVRYAGIGYVVYVWKFQPLMLRSLPASRDQGQYVDQFTNCFDDKCSRIMYDALDLTDVVLDAIMGVIMIIRLHAMYQRSRKVLIFLIVIFVAIRIAIAVMSVIFVMQVSGEEFILSGTYHCLIGYAGDSLFLVSMTWILGTIWEVIALCLAAWIAVKHFRELRQHSTGDIIEDCFTVLMKTHVSYFASFVVISCFRTSSFFLTNPFSLDTEIYLGFAQIFHFVELFVLGPRLILGVREFHAELVANSDEATAMTSIAFQEHVHVSTSSSV